MYISFWIFLSFSIISFIVFLFCFVVFFLVLFAYFCWRSNQPHQTPRKASFSLLANINHKFSVLAITETWVKESNVNDLSFEGYNFVSNHCANRVGGGVGLFIDQNFSYKILSEFNFSDENIFESLFVEICIPRHKNIIIGHLHDGVILLLRPESFGFLLSCAN